MAPNVSECERSGQGSVHVEDPSVQRAEPSRQRAVQKPCAWKESGTMRGRNIASGLGLGVGIALLLSGCQTLAGTFAPVPKDSQVRITMNEWAMKPSVASVPAGKVTFQAVNQGAVLHEMVVMKTDLAPNALKMKANEDKMDEATSGTNVGEIEGIASGATKTETFDLASGHYLLVCNEIGHYHQGMVSAFDVK